MSSKYDKSVSISHEREEEGSYHRREYDYTPAAPKTSYSSTKHYSSQLVPARGSSPCGSSSQPRGSGSRQRLDTSDDDDSFQEWTTSRKKVNHKTRQVETRVSRQLLVEDGKVIADSGPQVTTRIKEDNKFEEREREKAPKNKGKFDAISNAPECDSASGRVLGEKKEISKVSREVREENMQYHDERFKELTGSDVHRRAIKAPHELITVNDKHGDLHSGPPRGKMVHYSNKGKLYKDTDEILEVAKLALDGSITKEVKRTHHHEEQSEDELPDESGEAERLRRKPVELKSNRRRVDYVNDFDDTATPPESSGDEIEGDPEAIRRAREHSGSRRRDEAFPKYRVGGPAGELHHQERSGRARKVPLVQAKNQRSESSDDQDDREALRKFHEQRRSSQSPRGGAVEIPEEYRVNKQRLMQRNKSPASSLIGSGSGRERSFSPTGKSHLSHRSGKSQRAHRENAAVQAHLTDEEIEKKSSSSSASSQNSHEKQTRHLQRQSTANSSRNYYFGQPRHKGRAGSVRSSSSQSSLCDPKEQMRRSGARSKDSGFRSPNQQNIYAVSSKSKKGASKHRDLEGALSPTPTSGSVGQRSVKTTTTTLSAGLADRPSSRQSQERHHRREQHHLHEQPTRPERSRKSKLRGSSEKEAHSFDGFPQSRSVQTNTDEQFLVEEGEDELFCKDPWQQSRGRRWRPEDERDRGEEDFTLYQQRDSTSDNISITSSSQNGTTIRVPYKRIIAAKQHEPLVAESMAKRSHSTDISKQPPKARDSVKRIPIELAERQTTERRKRLADEERELEHFDYKTIVGSVEESAPVAEAMTANQRKNVVEAYNVRVIQHKSPFVDNKQEPIKSVSDLSSSIARLELLSSELGSRKSNLKTGELIPDNNNDGAFDLRDYVKHRALPAVVDDSGLANSSSCLEDDRVSLMSSCSMRTYNISSADNNETEQQLPDEAEVQAVSGCEQRLAAWIFDPRDNSTTAIVAPPKPKKPETPKIETEELAEKKGGRSYYLELIDREASAKSPSAPGEAEKAQPRRGSSIDSFYSRWSSQNNLNSQTAEPRRQSSPSEELSRSSRQILPARLVRETKRPNYSSSTALNNQKANEAAKNAANKRRQLPFGGPPLTNRSSSSSCLLNTTPKPSKYSIYGGLKRENVGNKPVPRLSYSRAIGPKSQRQIDAQPKVPSRYLKMK